MLSPSAMSEVPIFTPSVLSPLTFLNILYMTSM